VQFHRIPASERIHLWHIRNYQVGMNLREASTAVINDDTCYPSGWAGGQNCSMWWFSLHFHFHFLLPIFAWLSCHFSVSWQLLFLSPFDSKLWLLHRQCFFLISAVQISHILQNKATISTKQKLSSKISFKRVLGCRCEILYRSMCTAPSRTSGCRWHLIRAW
jgi:hypothetical protein